MGLRLTHEVCAEYPIPSAAFRAPALSAFPKVVLCRQRFCPGSTAEAAELQNGVQFDRIRRDADLAVEVIEEGDSSDTGVPADANCSACDEHLYSPHEFRVRNAS